MTENTYCIYIYTSHFFTIYIYRFTFTVSTFYRFTALQCPAFCSCAFFSCAGVGLRTEVNWLIFTQSSVLKTPRRNCNHIYIYKYVPVFANALEQQLSHYIYSSYMCVQKKKYICKFKTTCKDIFIYIYRWMNENIDCIYQNIDIHHIFSLYIACIYKQKLKHVCFFYIYITQLINNWYIKTWYLFRQMVLYIYKHSPGILLQTSLSKWLPLPSVSELASATSPHCLAPSFPDVSSHQWVKHIFAPEVEFHVHMQNDYGDSRCSDRYSIYIW